MIPATRRVRIALFLALTVVYCGTPSTNRAEALGGFCPIGQPWPGYDLDWIEHGTISGGGETFYALVDPSVSCACPAGFELTTIDFFMTFPSETPLPVTITVSMGFAEAIANSEDSLPWLPGPTLCETPVRDFNFSMIKEYVGFGIGLDCECTTMGDPYFLFFTVHSPMDPPGGFYTDGSGAPDLGRFLTATNGQWVDLVEAGMLTGGGLVVAGSARCCELPIDVTRSSWGGVKALYQ